MSGVSGVSGALVCGYCPVTSFSSEINAVFVERSPIQKLLLPSRKSGRLVGGFIYHRLPPTVRGWRIAALPRGSLAGNLLCLLLHNCLAKGSNYSLVGL